MSGAVSGLGMDLGAQHKDDLAIIALIVGGFALGCVLTGALVVTSALALRRRYALVLARVAAVLALSTVLQGGVVHVGLPWCGALRHQECDGKKTLRSSVMARSSLRLELIPALPLS